MLGKCTKLSPLIALGKPKHMTHTRRWDAKLFRVKCSTNRIKIWIYDSRTFVELNQKLPKYI